MNDLGLPNSLSFLIRIVSVKTGKSEEHTIQIDRNGRSLEEILQDAQNKADNLAGENQVSHTYLKIDNQS